MLGIYNLQLVTRDFFLGPIASQMATGPWKMITVLFPYLEDHPS